MCRCVCAAGIQHHEPIARADGICKGSQSVLLRADQQPQAFNATIQKASTHMLIVRICNHSVIHSMHIKNKALTMAAQTRASLHSQGEVT